MSSDHRQVWVVGWKRGACSHPSLSNTDKVRCNSPLCLIPMQKAPFRVWMRSSRLSIMADGFPLLSLSDPQKKLLRLLCEWCMCYPDISVYFNPKLDPFLTTTISYFFFHHCGVRDKKSCSRDEWLSSPHCSGCRAVCKGWEGGGGWRSRVWNLTLNCR